MVTNLREIFDIRKFIFINYEKQSNNNQLFCSDNTYRTRLHEENAKGLQKGCIPVLKILKKLRL